MELKLNPWQRFLMVSVLLMAGSIVFFLRGGVDWFLGRFSDPATFWSTIVLLIIFLLIFVTQGGVGAYRIQYERRALDALRQQGLSNHTPTSRILAQTLSHFANAEVVAATSTRKMKVDVFVDHYETLLFGLINGLERSKELLVTLGIFGTVAGIVIGLTSSNTSDLLTPEGVQDFSLVALQGVGLSYLTTLMALFGALIVYYLRIGYQPVVEEMVADYGLLLEVQLLADNQREDTHGPA